MQEKESFGRRRENEFERKEKHGEIS